MEYLVWESHEMKTKESFISSFFSTPLLINQHSPPIYIPVVLFYPKEDEEPNISITILKKKKKKKEREKLSILKKALAKCLTDCEALDDTFRRRGLDIGVCASYKIADSILAVNYECMDFPTHHLLY